MSTPLPMSDAEKQAARDEFLSRNHGYLADGARDIYERLGRGFWRASVTRSLGQFRGCQWVPESEYAEMVSLGEIPDSGVTDVTRQVATYDPRHQYVLYLEHRDGTTGSYMLRFAPIGRG